MTNAVAKKRLTAEEAAIALRACFVDAEVDVRSNRFQDPSGDREDWLIVRLIKDYLIVTHIMEPTECIPYVAESLAAAYGKMRCLRPDLYEDLNNLVP